jgi:sigma-E factor negative regulatory protein RseA
MTREISELMDGELDATAAQALISRSKGASPLDEDWALYHLIGDTIRQQAFFSPRLLEQVSARLAAEPTVLVPRTRFGGQKFLRYAAAAAAAAAVVAVAWIGIQAVGDAPGPQMASVQEPAARPASVPMPTRINDYLLAHQEYSPSSVVHGVAPYVRTVSMTPEAGGR